MKKKSLFTILFIIVTSLWGNNISESVSYFTESTSSFTSPKSIPSENFTKNNQPYVGLGFQKSYTWIRIPITSEVRGKALVIDDSKLSEIVCYIPDSTGGFLDVPWSRVEHNPRREITPSFNIPTYLTSDDVLFLKVRSRFKIRFNITALDMESHQLQVKQTTFFLGILLGTLIALLLYNVFISAYLFDKSYLLYVLYIFAFTLYEISKSGVSALFGISLLRAMVPLTIITILMAGFFSISYLQLKNYTRRGYWLMNQIMIPVGFIFLVLSFLSPDTLLNKYLNIYIISGVTLIVFNGVITARRGNRTARPYLTAWSILFISGITFIERDVLKLPHNFITNNLILIGGSLTSMILSIGLAQHIRDIQHERETMSKREESLTEMAQTDPLTGLYNKRYFETTLGEKLHNRDSALSVAVLDIDHFKKYNDTYGHLEGDTVLRVIGELLYDNVEEEDIPIRYGGEEFVIIMPHTTLEEACERCENIRMSTENLHFVLSKGTTSRVTISIGVAEASENESGNQLFIRADKALYKAKKDGRNRVVAANHDLE